MTMLESFKNMQMVDLSVPLGPSPSEQVPVELHRFTHQCGGAHLAQLVGFEQDVLKDGLGWASERVQAITHNSTHVDAPFHYSPTCNGAPSRTIDEVPIEWFWGPGICLDISAGCPEPLTVDEFLRLEERCELRVAGGDIVLFRTGAEERYGRVGFTLTGRGLTSGVVELLAERGVRVFGTDAWSIDASYPKMRERALAHGSECIWEAHLVGRHREFCAIEKLTNLGKLPLRGFWVSCFPVKVLHGSAGWTRAVAIVPGQALDGNARK
jgi:kynurenine formamidase